MSGVEKDAALINALVDYAGISLTEVAKRAKVDPETLRKPVRGIVNTRLSQRTIEKLHDAFPKFPGWTRAGAAALASFEQPDLGAEEALLLEQFDQLSLHDRETVLALIDVLVGKSKGKSPQVPSHAVDDKQSTYLSSDM